jgi:hypothetical protein
MRVLEKDTRPLADRKWVENNPAIRKKNGTLIGDRFIEKNRISSTVSPLP